MISQVTKIALPAGSWVMPVWCSLYGAHFTVCTDGQSPADISLRLFFFIYISLGCCQHKNHVMKLTTALTVFLCVPYRCLPQRLMWRHPLTFV